MAATLYGLKAFMRITHDDDDVMLQAILDGAEADALEFCDRTELPDNPAVDVAIYMTSRALSDATTPDDAEKWRDAARLILWPFREKLGA